MPPEYPAPVPTGTRKIGALALLVAATFFMENLDATAMVPAIPRMADSFGTAPVDLHRGISAYLLTLGIFIPASGWVADRFGARTVFVSAIALFTLGSMLCGIAQTLPQFIATRIIQAIGGALMVPVGRLVVLRATPKAQLVQAIALLTWPALGAMVLGPPLGGFIADNADWRWIFYVNLPLGLLAATFAWKLVPVEPGQSRHDFDVSGFMLTGGALFFLLSVAELLGEMPVAWAGVAGCLALGMPLTALALRHLRKASAPIVQLSVLRHPTFAVAAGGGSIFRMGISAMPFLLPLMFQIGFRYSAFQAGAMLTVVFAGNIASKPMTRPLLDTFGFQPVLVATGVLNIAVIACCALISPTMPFAILCAILFVSGFLRSLQFTALGVIAFADIPMDEMSAANTLFYTIFQISVGLGVALGALAWRLAENIVPDPAPPAMPFQIAFALVALAMLPGLRSSLRLAPDAGRHLLEGGPAKT